MENERLKHIYKGVMSRCYNPKAYGYEHYGGRGISMCEEWKNDFNSFAQWALSNGYQDKLTIDRINNDGNYEPSNCQWITRRQNSSKGNKKDFRRLEERTISNEHLAFVARVAAAKRLLQLTDADLGKMTGYATDTIGAFMCGKRQSRKVRAQLASVLGIDD